MGIIWTNPDGFHQPHFTLLLNYNIYECYNIIYIDVKIMIDI